MLPRPRIAITPGEPAGIGMDLCLLKQNHHFDADLYLVCDPNLLKTRAQTLKIPYTIDLNLLLAGTQAEKMTIVPVLAPSQCFPGKPSPALARYVLDCVDLAVEGCLQQHYDAIVTGPINKEVINQAGLEFSGHTEYLEKKVGGTAVMMLQTPGLRVVLVTTHVPLTQVSKLITSEKLTQVITVTERSLRIDFGIKKPRLLVCGLNPHAGEGGYLGEEEITVISPVIRKLQQQGMSILGPLPADTVFIDKYLQQADAVITMYHDQGLPVLKHMGFGRASNITLGLPIVRTSVDHGTAFDLAGTGNIDTGSFDAAISTALEIVAHRRLYGIT